MLGSRPCEVVQCVQGAASLGCADDSESFAQRENLRLTRGVLRPGNTELRSEHRDRERPASCAVLRQHPDEELLAK